MKGGEDCSPHTSGAVVWKSVNSFFLCRFPMAAPRIARLRKHAAGGASGHHSRSLRPGLSPLHAVSLSPHLPACRRLCCTRCGCQLLTDRPQVWLSHGDRRRGQKGQRVGHREGQCDHGEGVEHLESSAHRTSNCAPVPTYHTAFCCCPCRCCRAFRGTRVPSSV